MQEQVQQSKDSCINKNHSTEEAVLFIIIFLTYGGSIEVTENKYLALLFYCLYILLQKNTESNMQQ